MPWRRQYTKDRDIVIRIVFHKAFINNDTIVSQNLTKKRTKRREHKRP